MTPKQARFVEEYLIDLCATAAAKRAGYSQKMADRIGYQLLEKPRVREAIAEGQKKKSEQTGVTIARVIEELRRLAFSDLRSVMEWGPHGVIVRDSSELTDAQAAAVAEVSQTWGKDGAVSSIKVKLHNKTDALDKLCRHLGAYNLPIIDKILKDLDELKGLTE